MNNQEALQILKAKEAHLKDSINQLQEELAFELQSLEDVRKEYRTIQEDACNHEYERKAFFCGNDCEYSQVCKHCHKVL